jgi:hypothetical protein
MTNLSKRFGKIKRGDVRAQAAFVGWHDARLGLPPRPEYVEHSSQTTAAAYHNHRLLLLEAKRAGIKLPGWNKPSQIPPTIKALRTILAQICVANDEPVSALFSGALTVRRPLHLIQADLKAAMEVSGLHSLAASMEVSQTY